MLRKAFTLLLAFAILVESIPYQFNNGSWNSIFIGNGPNYYCEIRGDQLYRNGQLVRTLTAADQRELAVYNSKVQVWSDNLNMRIQHQINLQMNEFRKQMNAVFGPGGSFQRSFQGPFWNNRNRPAPTTMPLLPVEETKPIPEMPFPDPPAFCYEGH